MIRRLSLSFFSAALLSGCVAQAPQVSLTALALHDGGTVNPYVKIVAPPPPDWWMKGLPLPDVSMSLAALSEPASWMRAYDFDGDHYLSRAEATHGWLIRLAHWKTGRPFAATDLMIGNRPQNGFIIALADERAARAALDTLPASATALRAMIDSLSLSASGGDSGEGRESAGEDGWKGPGALFRPGAGEE